MKTDTVYYVELDKDELLYSLILYYSEEVKTRERHLSMSKWADLTEDYYNLSNDPAPEEKFTLELHILIRLGLIEQSVDKSYYKVNYWQPGIHMIKIDKELLYSLCQYHDPEMITTYLKLLDGYDYRGREYIFYFNKLGKNLKTDIRDQLYLLFKHGLCIALPAIGYHGAKAFKILQIKTTNKDSIVCMNDAEIEAVLGR